MNILQALDDPKLYVTSLPPHLLKSGPAIRFSAIRKFHAVSGIWSNT